MEPRILAAIAANPVIHRHRVTSLSGARLAAPILLFNLTLAAVHVGFFIAFASNSFEEGYESGAWMQLGHFGALQLLSSILIPLKLAGFIEGPRSERVLDQVVVTGVSPLTLHFGNFLVGVCYVLLLLLMSAPFAATMAVIFELRVLDLLAAYGTLFIWSVVVVVAYMAAAVFAREWIAAPLTIATLLGLGLLGILWDGDWAKGWPPQLAELTPLRMWSRDFLARGGAGSEGEEWLAALLPCHLFTLDVPLVLYAWLSWAAACMASVLLCCLGEFLPLRGVGGSFGGVSMPAGRVRKLARRMRGGVVRRIELSFLYQNGPSWTRRWGVPLRLILSAVPVVFFWAVLSGLTYGAAPRIAREGFFSDERFLSFVVFCAAGLVAWAIFQCESRYRVHEPVPCGLWTGRRETCVAVLFGLLALTFLAIQLGYLELALAHARSHMGEVPHGGIDAGALDSYRSLSSRFVLTLVLLVVNMFLLSRVLSAACNGPFEAAVTTLGLPGAYLAMAVMLEGAHRARPPPVLVECLLWFSPFWGFHFARFGDTDQPWWPAYATAHGALAACLILLIWLQRRRPRKPSTVAAVAPTGAAT